MSSKVKYYFRSQHDEHCYTLDYHVSEAKEQGLDAIDLYEAEPEKIGDMFYCKAVGMPGENGSCGKQCPDYAPRNKKSGMCKYRSNIFYACGEKVTISLKKEDKQ